MGNAVPFSPPPLYCSKGYRRRAMIGRPDKLDSPCDAVTHALQIEAAILTCIKNILFRFKRIIFKVISWHYF
jgi:hypothetical protein